METETQSVQALTGDRGANMEEPPVEDRRLLFIADFVLKSLKVKQDKWQKCVSGEENRQVLRDFLESAEQRSLVVGLTGGGTLQAAAGFSAAPPRTKAVYFVKRGNSALTAETMRDKLTCGDMSPDPLEHFSAVVE
ncbi:unnamed protein product, partial [Pleuronectes platessa]